MNEKEDIFGLNSPIYRCPVCGQEYLPAEWWLPSDLLGEPKNISKTTDGKISFFTGEAPSYTTEYICDNCGAHLSITGNLVCKVEVKEENDFDSEYVSKINSKKINPEKGLFDEDTTEEK